jgi:hypothetical protein
MDYVINRVYCTLCLFSFWICRGEEEEFCGFSRNHCMKYWALFGIVSVEEAAAVAAADSAAALSSTAGTTCRTT